MFLIRFDKTASTLQLFTENKKKILFLDFAKHFFLVHHMSIVVAQSVGHLTRKSGVLGSIPGLATYFFFPSAFSRRAVVSYWRKYVHEV